MAWAQILVGCVLMPATCPWCSRLGVLNTEHVALGSWPPLEFECRLTVVSVLMKKCGLIKCRSNLHRTHRTWISNYGGHTGFSSKSRCNSFVNLIPVEVRISRSWCLIHLDQSAEARRCSRVASIVSYSWSACFISVA